MIDGALRRIQRNTNVQLSAEQCKGARHDAPVSVSDTIFATLVVSVKQLVLIISRLILGQEQEIVTVRIIQ